MNRYPGYFQIQLPGHFLQMMTTAKMKGYWWRQA
jgi:hypothetical protein